MKNEFLEPPTRIINTYVDMGAYENDITNPHPYIWLPDTVTSINQNNKHEFSVDVYPNPAISETSINIKLTEKSIVTIEIFDIQGKKITTLVNNTYEPGEKRFVWEIGNNAQGTYVCKTFINNILSNIDKIVVQ